MVFRGPDRNLSILQVKKWTQVILTVESMWTALHLSEFLALSRINMIGNVLESASKALSDWCYYSGEKRRLSGSVTPVLHTNRRWHQGIQKQSSTARSWCWRITFKQSRSRNKDSRYDWSHEQIGSPAQNETFTGNAWLLASEVGAEFDVRKIL